METPPSGTLDRRVLRDSARWFREGAEARQRARLDQRCVECRQPLPTRRTPYCSTGCRWRYHGRFFWDAARVVVFRRDHYRCRSCGRRARRRELEVDHVLEIARGGPSLEYSNLQTLCRECHRAKTVRFLRERRRSAGTIPAAADDSTEPEWFPA